MFPSGFGKIHETASFNPRNSIFYEKKYKKKKPSLILKSNPFEEKQERRLINSVGENDLMDVDPSFSKVIFTKKYKNMLKLTSDDDDLEEQLLKMDKKKLKTQPRDLQGAALQPYHFTKSKHIHSYQKNNQADEETQFLKMLNDKSAANTKMRGIDNLSMYSMKTPQKKMYNIPIRILSRRNHIRLSNSFNEKAIKSLLRTTRDKETKKHRKLFDMNTFASPLMMFQRMPMVPNRMGHSILFSLTKMFGGKLNIKVPPQPPVIMVNQSPYYSTI